MAEVKIDVDVCIGCGVCVKKCPGGFELNDNMKAQARDHNAPCVKEAADACPVGAIEVIGEIVPSDAPAVARDAVETPKKSLDDYKGVMVFAEQRGGKLVNVAFELLGRGRGLADELDPFHSFATAKPGMAIYSPPGIVVHDQGYYLSPF
jgi:electron transfer flavoprotein alpha subunit